jgi:hypothetical protein
MPGSLTTPDRSFARITLGPCCLPCTKPCRHPGLRFFRGSMAGLCTPLSTLRRDPRGNTTHDSGPVWVASPSPYETLTHYSLPVSRRTLRLSAVDFPVANSPLAGSRAEMRLALALNPCSKT